MSAVVRAAAAAGVVVALTATAATGASAPPQAEAGTVETIAGPEFCAGTGVLDPALREIRAVAIDARATFIDTGPVEDGVVVRVAENGMASLLRTGVPRAVPGTLAADGDGGYLIASKGRVVHLPAAGGSVTIAGDPLGGTGGVASGDGGPAGDARFAGVRSLAIDEAGNVYVADELDSAAGTVHIRLINRSDEAVIAYPGTLAEISVAPGHIDTIAAGDGGHGNGDGEAALAATLQGDPLSLAATAGRLYIASYDAANGAPTASVRMINLGGQLLVAHGVRVPAGVIQTVAGGGRAGHSSDGTAARRASLGRMPGIATDAAGTVYLADVDHHRVRRIDPAGVLGTFAGTSSRSRGGFNGNDRPASQARLDRPVDVEVSPDGRVFIADQGNGQLRVVDEQGLIQAAQGNGLMPAWSCEEAADPSAPLSRPDSGPPVSVAAAQRDVSYFVVDGSARVYRREPSGNITSLADVFGDPDACAGGPPCLREEGEQQLGEGRLVQPVAVATNERGGLYVLDAHDGGRLLVANLGRGRLQAHGESLAPGDVATVAVDVLANETRSPSASMALDDEGDVFIADSRQVRRLDAAGDLTTVVDGVELGDRNLESLMRHDVERLAASGCCVAPAGLAVDGSRLYVSDGLAARVWVLNLGREPVSAHGHTIAAGAWEVVAGSGRRGFSGDGASAVDAKVRSPSALESDADGNLYIADREEHTIRRVNASGTISTVAGTGNPGFNGDHLKAGLTALSAPQGLALDSCRNLLIADADNRRLRRWNIAGPCADPRSEEVAERGEVGSALLPGLLGLGLFGSLVAGALVVRRRRLRRVGQSAPGSPAAARLVAAHFFREPSG